MSIRDKVVIITGASSGIGEATARKLAHLGAKLVIAARRENRLKELADSLPDAEVTYLAADVTKEEDVRAVAEAALGTYGRIDVLLNNAGIMPQASLSEGRIDEWRQTMDINVMGVLYGIAAVLPTMKKQQSGHIITIGSEAGYTVFPGGAVYCGSKYAVRAIMEGLRIEERENNIRTTLVSPGTVNTELHMTINDPAKREWTEQLQNAIGLQADDVADAIIHAMDAPETATVSETIILPTKTQFKERP